jgi:hypothetical protein
VLALELTEKIGLVALVLTTATLLVAATTLGLNVRWRRRAGHAELVAESHLLNENQGVPSGWQVFVYVRNTGVAPAFEPDLWIEPGDSCERRNFPPGRGREALAWRGHKARR